MGYFFNMSDVQYVQYWMKYVQYWTNTAISASSNLGGWFSYQNRVEFNFQ